MKHYLSTFAGSAICGGFAFGIWPELWKTYGLMGGWLAATLIIGIMWYMNHYNGAILNPPGKIWLDQRSEERRVGKECRSRWSPYH